MLQTCYSTLETPPPPPPPPVDTWHLLMQSYYSSPVMGRKKLALKKIENSTARQVTYSKRKDGMIKKAHELAVLCDIDIALIMFSPSGRLTTFSSSRRVEDIFLRFLCRPDELKGGSNSSQELLIQKLRKLKFEAEMLEKASQIEELEAKLEQLSKRKHETMEKMRHYQPELQRINTSIDVDVHVQFIEGALNGVHMARARLLGKEVIPEGTGNTEGLPSNSEVAAFSMVAESSTTNNEYADHQQTRGIGVQERELIMEEYQPIGPHLSLDYIRRAQNQWYTFPSQRTPSPAYL